PERRAERYRKSGENDSQGLQRPFVVQQRAGGAGGWPVVRIVPSERQSEIAKFIKRGQIGTEGLRWCGLRWDLSRSRRIRTWARRLLVLRLLLLRAGAGLLCHGRAGLRHQRVAHTRLSRQSPDDPNRIDVSEGRNRKAETKDEKLGAAFIPARNSVH